MNFQQNPMLRQHPHYKLHQTALLPALGVDLTDGWHIPDAPQIDDFAEFLVQQKMQGYWAQAIDAGCQSEQLKKLKSHLDAHCRLSIALELPQQRLMQEAHELLNTENIPYFFAKGAQLRQVAYQKPWHRPASDVDVFIDQRDKQKAIKAFQAHGFSSHPEPATISHEINIGKYGSYIDLHWHLMRPSRYQQQLDHWLFLRREKFGDYWGLDNTASLLVMLTHPAITKYLISPTSMLIHQVDQLKLMESKDIDWVALSKALQDSGLKTAAWSSVYLLQLLTGREIYSAFEQSIRPNSLKRRYLEFWIDKAWISRLFGYRWLVAAGFNLALQDSFREMVRAAGSTLKSKHTAALTLPQTLES